MIADPILGRDQELATMVRFFEEERSGPRVLLLEGEAGIGKSTLWREGVRLAAARSHALVSRPSETEAALSFTVVGDLLAPILQEALEHLPDPQREALEVALLLASPTRSHTGARTVSLAVLGVLRSLAADGPLTVAIDDVQWTDSPSARTLAFAFRRLGDQPIRVLAAKRVGHADPLDLGGAFPGLVDRLTLGPIAPVTLGRLVRHRLHRDFGPPLVRRIHEMSGGNPFFALEIGRALGDEHPLLKPGEPLPVPADIQELLRRRLSALSATARRAVLFAASSGAPTSALVERAGGDRSGLEEAEGAGIVMLRTERIEFAHPLLASAVYLEASAPERREVHGRLAAVAADAEERARHLALSSVGPDEAVAEALEEAALQAQARGAPSAAADLNSMAAALTPPGAADREKIRRFRAMGNLFVAGDVVAARQIAERTVDRLDAGPERALVLYATASMAWNNVAKVKERLTRALSEAGDDRLRSQIESDLAWAALWSCDPASAIAWAESAIDLAERFVGVESIGNPLTPNDHLRVPVRVRAVSQALLGHDAMDALAHAAEVEGEGDLNYGDLSTPRACLGWLQMWAGELDAARQTLNRELDRYVAQGHETASWECRILLSEVELRAGRWEEAYRSAREATEIVLEAGWTEALTQILPVRSAIEAAIGDRQASREDGAKGLDLSERMGARWNEIQARSALGFLELSLGDHARAHEWLDPIVGLTDAMGVREPGAFPFVPDEVEALIRLGEIDRATTLTDGLAEQGEALDRPLALATAARCRGLVETARGHRDAALRALSEAVQHHAGAGHPFELGRTLLVLGETQRHFKQRKDAQTSLEAARAIFDRVGAPLWVDRAEGAMARLGRVVPSGSLTPTESKVAELVAAGRTNREIADGLFLSVKTVEANVSRILSKLGVASRREVAGSLTGSPERR